MSAAGTDQSSYINPSSSQVSAIPPGMALEFIIAFDIFTHCLQIAGTAAGATFLYLSWKNGLIKSPYLYLIHILIFTDFLNAMLTIPYTGYLTSQWNNYTIYAQPLFVMITAIPLLAQIKINMVIVAAIAIDRLLALFFPVIYRRKNNVIYVIVVVIFAVDWGAFDNVLMFQMTNPRPTANCSTIGCFVDLTFKAYWQISNAMVACVIIILIVIIDIKLRIISKNKSIIGTAKEQQRFNKANRSAVCTLTCSLICISASLINGFVQITGKLTLLSLPPLYVFGLCAAGTVHSISQLIMNKELLMAKKKKKTFLGATTMIGPATSTTRSSPRITISN